MIVPWQLWLMSVLRFLAIFFISFLLLSPLIKRTREIVEKPLIIFAQDNSLSISFSSDSSFYKKEYPSAVDNLKKKLGKRFDFTFLTFGDKVVSGLKTTYSEKVTDISAMFDEINTTYSNRNIGALVLASDGIYNRGTSPYYTAQKTKFPVYTIGMGDTLSRRDIILKKITHNRKVFTGDKFPVEVLISADECAGEKSELQVKHGNQIVFSRPLQFSGEHVFTKIPLLLEAGERGIQRYQVILQPVSGETTLINNQRDFFIEVNDTRQKVVILYRSPHPDISAIKHALESSARYEVKDLKPEDFNYVNEKPDLVILSQLPGNNDNLKLLMESRISLLFITGGKTKLNEFNNLKSGLVITSDRESFSESLPLLNENFPLFTVNPEIRELLKAVPPLMTPFGFYQHSPMADILIYQKIGNVQSPLPLIMFTQNAGKKTGFITGENLWKWRLTCYLQNNDHKAFDELINKIAQYLAVKGDEDFFRINFQQIVNENENVVMEAEVFNESYELINENDVNLTITDEQNRSYPFIFSKTRKGYYLDAGAFPVGRYKFSASVKVGKNLLQRKGEFIVTPLNLEELKTSADLNLMFRIAKSHDGEMFSPHQLDKLEEAVNKREDIRPVSYFQKRYSDITGTLWFFLLILFLLSAEWFFRKRNGIY